MQCIAFGTTNGLNTGERDVYVHFDTGLLEKLPFLSLFITSIIITTFWNVINSIFFFYFDKKLYAGGIFPMEDGRSRPLGRILNPVPTMREGRIEIPACRDKFEEIHNSYFQN